MLNVGIEVYVKTRLNIVFFPVAAYMLHLWFQTNFKIHGEKSDQMLHLFRGGGGPTPYTNVSITIFIQHTAFYH